MVKDISKLRKDFPILDQKMNGEPLVYLDSAATTQKPKQVIDAINNYYLHDNANVHRGVYELSERATNQFEQVREKVRKFINAKSEREIVYTRGTTDGLNMIASTYGEAFIHEGDEIVISYMEHHSNLIPWQQLALRKHAK